MVERGLHSAELERYGTWHAEIEDPSSLVDPLAVARVVGKMRADLIPLADRAGVCLPSLDAGVEQFMTFLDQLFSEQVREAFEVIQRTNRVLFFHWWDRAATSLAEQQGGEPW
ncbi:hypothetical protein [Streptomyces sp. TS71-3]|uniref:hypothetical protein n=1 Tax=Streptomyces sp. TS71-3 TaxID=2733862 RepID=UPI001B098647|nr:hypothetical protein [Streptomyces sp. TS71-3]GHJ34475.1 hypothetical protein Sm713_00840 [Streptomyces sp. TS71-3]